MTDVQFSGEQFAPAPMAQPQQSFLMRMAYGTGLVSTDEQAQYVLIGIAVVAALLAAYVLFGTVNHPPAPPAVPPGASSIPPLNGI